MKVFKLSALLLGAALFTGIGVTTLSAEMKCGAGKCGSAMEKPSKCEDKDCKIKDCDGKKCDDAEKGTMKCGGEKGAMKCGGDKKAPKKAMKCGTGKCG